MLSNVPSKLTLPMLPLRGTAASTLKGISLAVGAAIGLSGGILPLAANALPGYVSPPPGPTGPGGYNPGVYSPGSASPPPQSLSDVRFSCQTAGGQYTVMYSPKSQPGRLYPWATPTALGGGWDPASRCYEISRRLEAYRPDGLIEMQTAVENGYNTICVTTQQVPACRIVLTVPPGEDPVAIRNRVFSNLTVADSGQQTAPVTTFTGGDNGLLNQIGRAIGVDLSSLSGSRRHSPNANRSNGIDLRPFLDRADGGTGARLQGGVSGSVSEPSGSQLNPDNFR